MGEVIDNDNKSVDTDRTEDKYILEKQYLIETIGKIEKHMAPTYPDPNTKYTLNRSVYFDSPDLTFLKQHLNDVSDRRKIRIRMYAPNGGAWTDAYIEVKYKSNGDSKKNRLKINDSMIDSLIQHSKLDVTDDLYALNSEMTPDDVRTNAKLINYLLIINKAKPVVDITYKRYCFESDDTFKTTIDQDIRPKPLQTIKMNVITDLKNQDLWEDLMKYGAKFTNFDNFVLEIKHQDGVPDWVKEMLKKLGSDKPERFSKYVWSMARIISSELRMIEG